MFWDDCLAAKVEVLIGSFEDSTLKTRKKKKKGKPRVIRQKERQE